MTSMETLEIMGPYKGGKMESIFSLARNPEQSSRALHQTHLSQSNIRIYIAFLLVNSQISIYLWLNFLSRKRISLNFFIVQRSI